MNLLLITFFISSLVFSQNSTQRNKVLEAFVEERKYEVIDESKYKNYIARVRSDFTNVDLLSLSCGGAPPVVEVNKDNKCRELFGIESQGTMGSYSFFSYESSLSTVSNTLSAVKMISPQPLYTDSGVEISESFAQWLRRFDEFKTRGDCEKCFLEYGVKKEDHENFKKTKAEYELKVLKKVRKRRMKNLMRDYASYFEKMKFYEFLYPDSLSVKKNTVCRKEFGQVIRKNRCGESLSDVNDLIHKSMDEIGVSSSFGNKKRLISLGGRIVKRFKHTSIALYDKKNKKMCEKEIEMSKYFAISENAMKIWRTQNPEKEYLRKKLLNTITSSNRQSMKDYCSNLGKNEMDPLSYMTELSMETIVEDLSVGREGFCNTDKAAKITKVLLCKDEKAGGHTLLSDWKVSELKNSNTIAEKDRGEAERRALQILITELLSKNLQGDPQLAISLTDQQNFCQTISEVHSGKDFYKVVQDRNAAQTKAQVNNYSDNYCSYFKRELENTICADDANGNRQEIPRGDYINAFKEFDREHFFTASDKYPHLRDALACEMKTYTTNKRDDSLEILNIPGLEQSKIAKEALSRGSTDITSTKGEVLGLIANIDNICDEEVQNLELYINSKLGHQSDEAKFGKDLNPVEYRDLLNQSISAQAFVGGDEEELEKRIASIGPSFSFGPDEFISATPESPKEYTNVKGESTLTTKDSVTSGPDSLLGKMVSDASSEANSFSPIEKTANHNWFDYRSDTAVTSSREPASIAESKSIEQPVQTKRSLPDLIEEGKIVEAVKSGSVDKDHTTMLLENLISQNKALQSKIEALEKDVKESKTVKVKSKEEEVVLEGANFEGLSKNKKYAFSPKENRFVEAEEVKDLPRIQPTFIPGPKVESQSQAPSFGQYESTRRSAIRTSFNESTSMSTDNINSQFLKERGITKYDEKIWESKDVESYVEFIKQKASVGLILDFDQTGKAVSVKVPWQDEPVRIETIQNEKLKQELLTISSQNVVDMESDSYALYTMSNFGMDLDQFVKNLEKKDSEYSELLATVNEFKK